jgi:hypothetical protein
MSDCIYLPNKPEANGYVRVGRKQEGRERMAHRRAYVEAYGPIPEGFTVDHECHNRDETCPGGPSCKHRACVNPEHLRAVPTGTNILASPTHPAAINAAKTGCPSGHAYTEQNTYYGPKGDRQCRMCKLIWRQEQIRRKRAVEWGLADVGVIR